MSTLCTLKSVGVFAFDFTLKLLVLHSWARDQDLWEQPPEALPVHLSTSSKNQEEKSATLFSSITALGVCYFIYKDVVKSLKSTQSDLQLATCS
ncbi:hypothetical protein FRX31_020831 [Thalictrum thalictroides]|uniref:Uncharacterized protein n=1 Tax=Thalictrum thalictroides TaxID=46969 RepID=A0A7J6VYB2_THATH|nr:hypothetical protein FRX31_020831 [Thalictrum thalictroides]